MVLTIIRIIEESNSYMVSSVIMVFGQTPIIGRNALSSSYQLKLKMPIEEMRKKFTIIINTIIQSTRVKASSVRDLESSSISSQIKSKRMRKTMVLI